MQTCILVGATAADNREGQALLSEVTNLTTAIPTADAGLGRRAWARACGTCPKCSFPDPHAFLLSVQARQNCEQMCFRGHRLLDQVRWHGGCPGI